MARKKLNTNGFPTNGGFPSWLSVKRCSNCKNKIKFEHYENIGFYLSGKHKGKLYVNYFCPNCEEFNTMDFGDEKFGLERLCTLVIQHSKVMQVAEKEIWERKYSKE